MSVDVAAFAHKYAHQAPSHTLYSLAHLAHLADLAHLDPSNLPCLTLPPSLQIKTRTTSSAPRPASRRSRTPTRSSRTGRSGRGTTTTATRSFAAAKAAKAAPNTKPAATGSAAASPRTRTSTCSLTSPRRASRGTAAGRKGSTRSMTTSSLGWPRTSWTRVASRPEAAAAGAAEEASPLLLLLAPRCASGASRASEAPTRPGSRFPSSTTAGVSLVLWFSSSCKKREREREREREETKREKKPTFSHLPLHKKLSPS